MLRSEQPLACEAAKGQSHVERTRGIQVGVFMMFADSPAIFEDHGLGGFGTCHEDFVDVARSPVKLTFVTNG